MERLDLLGPQPLKLEKLENPLGERTFQLLIVFHASGRHQFRDLFRDRLADPLDLAEPTFGHQGGYRLAQRLQRPGGIRVGPDLEGVLPLEF